MVIFPDWRRPAPRGAVRGGAVPSHQLRGGDVMPHQLVTGFAVPFYKICIVPVSNRLLMAPTCSELRRASSARRLASAASISSSSASSAARLCATGSSGAVGSAATARQRRHIIAGNDGSSAWAHLPMGFRFLSPSCSARTRAARSCAVKRSSEDGAAAGVAAGVA